MAIDHLLQHQLNKWPPHHVYLWEHPFLKFASWESLGVTVNDSIAAQNFKFLAVVNADQSGYIAWLSFIRIYLLSKPLLRPGWRQVLQY